MLSTVNYDKLCDKLLEAVESVCRQCAEPCVPIAEMDFSDPEHCPCRCDHTRGLLAAIEGMRSGSDEG